MKNYICRCGCLWKDRRPPEDLLEGRHVVKKDAQFVRRVLAVPNACLNVAACEALCVVTCENKHCITLTTFREPCSLGLMYASASTRQTMTSTRQSSTQSIECYRRGCTGATKSAHRPGRD